MMRLPLYNEPPGTPGPRQPQGYHLALAGIG
jgi:hypothetical protein